MNPNWTKLGVLFRTLAILGASSFCGALALPLATDGTLPVTWTAWRPILAVAASAAAVAEFIWIRTHIQQAAQAIGVAISDAGTPPAVKTALLKIGIGAASSLISLFLGIFCVDCTPAQVAKVQRDTQQAIDLTDAVCNLAPESPVDQSYVIVSCAILEGGEQLVSVVVGAIGAAESDGGSTSMASATTMVRVPVKQIHFPIPAATSGKFLAAHKAKK
jgi:hypothetical protein